MRLKFLNIAALSALLLCGGYVSSCSEDKDEPVQVAKEFADLPESKDLPFSYESEAKKISFTSPGQWRVELEGGVDWVYFAPSSGKAGKNTLEVKVAQNTGKEGRAATFNLVSGDQKVMFTVRQPEFGGTLPDIVGGETGTIDPATIPDYDKFFANSEHGRGILYKGSQFSFARYKSSEHFFVFWAPEFGDNPNGPTVPAAMRVDIDDLLAKAEHFFDTNINKLHMATLGEGKSVLDDYKMQIYLLYQDEWLATGSGYDDMIGALWINPSTCQPVGSTIAHEIGHSFQYQTYADRVQKQGASMIIRAVSAMVSSIWIAVALIGNSVRSGRHSAIIPLSSLKATTIPYGLPTVIVISIMSSSVMHLIGFRAIGWRSMVLRRMVEYGPNHMLPKMP